jgi:DNA mismatch endonuclease (patch repair protein)
LPDVHDAATRSRNMRAVRASDTKPELAVRKRLHALGFRYVLGGKGLTGKPDLVFPRYKSVIFVHGCFWHGHGCSLFRWPSSRAEFWREKIGGNSSRDRRIVASLLADGWRVAVVWECALRGSKRFGIDQVIKELSAWLPDSDAGSIELSEGGSNGIC